MNLLYHLARAEGFCCSWLYLKRILHHRSRLLAAYLGVDPRSVRRYRAEFKAGLYECQRHKPDCSKCLRRTPPFHPLDDANTARRYSDKCRDTSSAATAWLESHGLASRVTSSKPPRPPE